MRSAVLLFITACRLNFDDVGRSVDASSLFLDAPSVSTYEQAVIADHPVAYWRLGDTGSIARDELGMHDGNYNAGVTTGVAGALVDDPNRAAAFNGMTGEITTTTGISFPGTASFTLEVWVYETDGPTYRHYLTCEPRIDGMPQQGYALFEAGTGVQFERIASPTAFDQSDQVAFAQGEWTQLVGVFTGSEIEVYVDSVLRFSAPALDLAEPVDAPIFIGAHVEGAFFSGTLDEVAIYDSALSQERIGVHYAIARGN